jgi:hypothetical protein
LALAALACDHTPEALMQALAAVPPPDAGNPCASAAWWTAGSPRVPGARAAMAGLPGASSFAGMIDAGGA